VRQLCLEEIAVERSRVKEGDAKTIALLDACVDSLTPINFYQLCSNQLLVANVLLPADEMKIGGSRVWNSSLASKQSSQAQQQQENILQRTVRMLRAKSCP
jgi:predicted phosphohydrolase